MKTITFKLYFGEAWSRNLLYLGISQFIAMIGMNAVIPFLPLYIRELGVSGESAERFWSGMVFAGTYFLAIIFVPIWGTLADRFGKKLMLMRAIFGLALAMFLMGFAQNVWHLFFLRIFQGMSSGFVAASLGFIVANTPSDHKGYAVGFLQSSQSAGMILGPLIGGFISDLIGFRFVFYLVAVLCLISATLIYFNVVEINKTKGDPESNLLTTFTSIFTEKKYISPLTMIFLAQVGIYLSFPILPYYIENLFAPKEYISTLTGLAVGLVGFLNVLFAPLWGKWLDKTNANYLLKKASIVLGCATLLHSVVPSHWFIYPLRAIMGMSLAGIIPVLYSYLGKQTPSEKIGSIMGLASASTLMGSLFAYLSNAILAPIMDLHWLFIISSGFLFSVYFLSKQIEKNSFR
ncbi:MAG: MFS transporter [Ignavibacteria bacterium]|nr:MFS transporter [Ignavibacteria bacterium]